MNVVDDSTVIAGKNQTSCSGAHLWPFLESKTNLLWLLSSNPRHGFLQLSFTVFSSNSPSRPLQSPQQKEKAGFANTDRGPRTAFFRDMRLVTSLSHEIRATPAVKKLNRFYSQRQFLHVKPSPAPSSATPTWNYCFPYYYYFFVNPFP